MKTTKLNLLHAAIISSLILPSCVHAEPLAFDAAQPGWFAYGEAKYGLGIEANSDIGENPTGLFSMTANIYLTQSREYAVDFEWNHMSSLPEMSDEFQVDWFGVTLKQRLW